MSTILRKKPCKKGYGGYQTRVHGISFKANILQWKKGIRWEHDWITNHTHHYIIRKDDITFIRHTSKNKDTLVLIVPDVLWNIRTKGSVTKEIKHKARLIMGEFANQYGIRLNGFVECSGTSYALPVRNTELVKMAQKKTVYFENGAILDASHGFPEFEAPLNIMQELLSLPDRVNTLEKEIHEIKQAIIDMTNTLKDMNVTMTEFKSSVIELKNIFSQPKTIDERKDVT